MSDLILTKDIVVGALTALVGVGGAANGAKVGLFKNDFVPEPTTILADLVQADFVGYALSSVVVWGEIGVDVNGRAIVFAPSKEFSPTDATVPNTIFGYFLVNGAGTVLLSAVRFDESVPLVLATDVLPVLPVLALPTIPGSVPLAND